MGAAVAERLICAGYDVVVWNRTPEKAAPLTELGASLAAGPSELAAGVSRAALLEVLCDSAAGAPFVKYKAEPLLRDDYSATFTTALMEKDVDLILEAADDAGVDLPVGGQLKSLLHATADAGYADHD